MIRQIDGRAFSCYTQNNIIEFHALLNLKCKGNARDARRGREDVDGDLLVASWESPRVSQEIRGRSLGGTFGGFLEGEASYRGPKDVSGKPLGSLWEVSGTN